MPQSHRKENAMSGVTERSEPTNDALIVRDVWVPMRDGVQLATDVYLPATGAEALSGPFPTLLVRTPYNKSSEANVENQGLFYARRGYAVVIQDCRGRYASGGEFYFLVQEAEDGYDTIVWVGEQPWCNGKVGTLGTSYLAWTQSALAALNPPYLAAMYPNEGGANAHTSSVRQNGAMELRFMAWGFRALVTGTPLDDPATVAALSKVRFRDWLQRMPLKEGKNPLSLVPMHERWVFDIWTRGDYDEYWQQPGFDFEKYAENHADVPILFSGAWYDSYTRSTLENFMRYSTFKRGPIRLMMGPWTHGGEKVDLTWSGDVEFGPEASIAGNLAFNVRDHHLRYFDHWLRGIDNGIEHEPPVRIFVMGGGDGHRTPEGRLFHGGRWREEQEWPLARTEFTNFYLGERGELTTATPEIATRSTSFRFDPNDPVPTIGGNISSLTDVLEVEPALADKVAMEDRIGNITSVGPQNQVPNATTFGAKPPYLPLASRQDVLVFASEPLTEPLEVTGPLTAKLWVSSSAPDTDITVKLIDVYPPNADYPDGYAMNVSDSIQRLRYRNSREHAEFMEPGEIYPVTIEMYGTSNVFNRDHRIRLDISSSNFPRFDVNPNTGEPLGRNTHTQVALNTIHHDAEHPSHIVLPLIPSESA
jgi:putative CocE/NonD family hydrolase